MYFRFFFLLLLDALFEKPATVRLQNSTGRNLYVYRRCIQAIEY